MPVGVFLSGGIDSSCVATAAVAAGGRMKAFSIGFDDATFDESQVRAHGGRAAQRRGITETLHERNLMTSMDVALDLIDEPMADPSFLPTFLLSRLAARHVKVVVGGDGGDELWGGYPTYRGHRFASMYQSCPAGSASTSSAASSGGCRSTIATGAWSGSCAVHRSAGTTTSSPATSAGCRASTCPIWRRRSRPRRAVPATLATRLPETDDWLQRIMALDFATYMPGSVLAKVDRASMAHGLEVRPPLLDDTLVDRSFALPSRYKLRRGTGSTC